MTMNLARGKPTKQSSLHHITLVASNAVDGQKSVLHPCSVTSKKVDNWWEVNLEAVYDIRVVTLSGAKCCGMLHYLLHKCRHTIVAIPMVHS